MYFLKIPLSMAKAWSQNNFNAGERGSKSRKNEVNWLEGFSIRVKRVTAFSEQIVQRTEVENGQEE